MSSPVVSKKVTLTVWGVLLGLLLLTWVVAQFNFGAWSPVIAMTISVAKLTLIMVYFMHLRYSSGLVMTFAVAGFSWLAILIAITLADYFTRS